MGPSLRPVHGGHGIREASRNWGQSTNLDSLAIAAALDIGSSAFDRLRRDRTHQQALHPQNLGCSRRLAGDEERLSQRGGYSGNRFERKESERFKSFSYEELAKRDP
jgi:hypothetical protein